MEMKKNPNLDTERQRVPLMLVGLFVTAAFVSLLFSFKSEDKGSGSGDDYNKKSKIEFEEVPEDVPPPPEETPPPPPETPEAPPPPSEDPKAVEDEKDQSKTSMTETPPPVVGPKKEIEKVIEPILDIVEEEPEFPGGEEAMMRFLQTNIKYPPMAIQMGDQGKVYVRFVVEPDGSISNAEIARGVTSEIDREALRVVQTMPKWKPGKQRGRAVRVRIVVPIVFKLG
jgi:protein TonB